MQRLFFFVHRNFQHNFILLLLCCSMLLLHERAHAQGAVAEVSSPAMTLSIDASNTGQGIFDVRQTIPVAGGSETKLYYPKWLPGKHAPRGPVNMIAGVKFTASGVPLSWRRDPNNIYAFLVDVTASAEAIEARFQFLSPTAKSQGRIVMTPAMLNLQWEKMLLYRADMAARDVRVAADIVLPGGWKQASALAAAQSGTRVRYSETTLETLIDSPVFAGAHYKSWPLGASVTLHVFADQPEDLAARPDQIKAHSELVKQALRMFGTPHYKHYHFLLALTDELGGIGLEHLESSENSRGRNYFTEWGKTAAQRGLLPHELVHSWNGKFVRPNGLETHNYHTPLKNELLWIYEGLTSYLDILLSTRAGLVSRRIAFGELAEYAAYHRELPARDWRPLADTVWDPVINARRPQAYRSWQRSEDYYREGALIWMEADMLIRTRSEGRRSLDTFIREFFV